MKTLTLLHSSNSLLSVNFKQIAKHLGGLVIEVKDLESRLRCKPKDLENSVILLSRSISTAQTFRPLRHEPDTDLIRIKNLRPAQCKT